MIPYSTRLDRVSQDRTRMIRRSLKIIKNPYYIDIHVKQIFLSSVSDKVVNCRWIINLIYCLWILIAFSSFHICINYFACHVIIFFNFPVNCSLLKALWTVKGPFLKELPCFNGAMANYSGLLPDSVKLDLFD